MGKPAEQWQYGNIEDGFAKADLILEESFVTQALTHHPMEPRSALAYWQNGKLYLHGSSQSVSFVVPGSQGHRADQSRSPTASLRHRSP